MIKRTLLLVCVFQAALWAQTSAGIQKGEVLRAPRGSSSSTHLLFPFVSTQAGYDSEIAISNTSEDTLGTTPHSGACTVRFYGAGAPGSVTTAEIPAGQQLIVQLSQGGSGVPALANFQGYAAADCSFPLARGGARIFSSASSVWQESQTVSSARGEDDSHALLFPYFSNRNTDDTLLAIANTSSAAGSCDVNFYGTNAPAKIVTDTIAAESVYTLRASAVAPAFEGYVTASCGFPAVAGAGMVESLFGAHPSIAVEPESLAGSRNASPESLFLPAVSNRNGLDSKIVIANTSSVPPASGTCTLNFRGVNAPAPIRTGEIAAGSVFSAATSSLAPGFEGSVLAECSFANARGLASSTAERMNSLGASSEHSTLLFPAVDSRSGADASFTIANAGDSRLAESTGTCRLSYFGGVADGGAAPAAQTSNAVRAGEQLTFSLSQGNPAFGIAGVPGFHGYVIADCEFPLARGVAKLTRGAGSAATSRNSKAVSGVTAPVSEVKSTKPTPKTPALPTSYIASTLIGGLPMPTSAQATRFPLGAINTGTLAVLPDPYGNVYFSTGGSTTSMNAVYKIDPSGNITRVAGNTFQGPLGTGNGGQAVSAGFNKPAGLALDSAGNLYIADTNNNQIRKVTPAGVISAVVGTGAAGSTGDNGAATAATLRTPVGLAIDSSGNLYIADSANFKIRMVNPAGTITTVVGTGTAGTTGDGSQAISATLTNPLGVAVDLSGNLYIADGTSHKVRKVSQGIISTYAGNGTSGNIGDGGAATAAEFGTLSAIGVDPNGNVYVADSTNDRVREIAPNGTVQGIAGIACNACATVNFNGDGSGNLVYLGAPTGVAADSAGNVYIADSANFRIRKVDTGGNVTTIAGNGSAPFAGDSGPAVLGQLGGANQITFDTNGNLYVADGVGSKIRKIDSSGNLSTIAGTGAFGYSGDGGQAIAAQFNYPHGLAFDQSGTLYVADTYNYCVRKITPQGVVSTYAGVCTAAGNSGDGGPATAAHLGVTFGLTFDPSGNLYISDGTNDRVRQVSPAGVITTFAGNGTAGSIGDGGLAVGAELNVPWGLASDSNGNIYIAESSGFRIRMVNTSGVISTFAGTGTNGATGSGGPATSAQFGTVNGIAFDPSGNLIVPDANRIHRVVNGVMTTIAGNGTINYAGDGGAALSASFIGAVGVAVDAEGNIYIPDGVSDRAIRVLRPAQVQPVLTISSPAQQVAAGQSNVQMAVTVTNSSAGAASSGTVTVAAQLPSDLSLVSIAGQGWTCNGSSCTSSSAIAAGGTATLTITVNVSATAAAQDVTYLTVSGGGSAAPAAGAVVLSVRPATPVLTAGMFHQGIFTQGESSATFTVFVQNVPGSNSNNAYSTSGTVTVADTLPAGLTLVSMAGTNWNCTGTSCSRSDALAPGATYPPLVVTVNVSANAVGPLTNSVTVSGGGSPNATATDTVLNGASLRLTTTPTSLLLTSVGSPIAVSVLNAGPYATSGAMTLTATLSTGLTFTSWASTGNFSCNGLTCTSSTALAPDASTALSINLGPGTAAPDSTGSVTFTLSGGGSATTTTTVQFPIAGASAPPNSVSTAPTLITTLPYRISEDVSDITGTQTNGIASCSTAPTNFVFFQYTATFTGTLFADTYGSNFRAGLSVFSGSIASGNQIACAASATVPAATDTVAERNNFVSFAVTSGTTYYILAFQNSPPPVPGTLQFELLNATAGYTLTQAANGSFQTGQQETFTINVTPTASLSGTITVSESLPSGFTLVSMQGTGWTCAGTICSRSDTLQTGTTYPITLTVLVSGTATSPQVSTVAIEGGGSTPVTATVSTTVTQTPLTVTTPATLTYSLGPIQIPLTASGGSGTGYTYSVSAGTLPAGLSIRTDGVPSYFPTGVTAGLIGVPTAAVYSPGATFTLQVKDSSSNTATLPVTLNIVPLTISEPGALPEGFVGASYSYTPTAVNGTGSVAWTVPNNGLPAGLAINSSTGLISGTPTAAGSFTFTLQATDSTGTIGNLYTMQIWTVGFTGSADLGTVNSGSAVNIGLAGSGGTGSYTFGAWSLPSGLSLSTSGTLSGTLSGGAGTVRFPVEIIDSAGNSYTRLFVMNVASMPTPPALGYPNPAEDLTLGEGRSYLFTAGGGTGPYTWSVASGTIPPGMRLVTANLPGGTAGPNDVYLEGAPTQLGTFAFTLGLEDSSSPRITVTQAMSLNVVAMTDDNPKTSYPANAQLSYYIDPVGGTSPYTWTLVSGALPNYLFFTASTGTISGDPEENGAFPVLFKIVDHNGITLNRYVTFNISSGTTPQLTFLPPFTLPDVVDNVPYSATVYACCSPNGVTYSVIGTLLPGLTLSANGVISGTTGLSSSTSYEFQATDKGNSANVATRYFTLSTSTIEPSVQIPTGVVGTAYSATLSATSSQQGATFTWSVTSGSQTPPGLQLSSAGVLSGTPTSAGTFTLGYTVTSSGASYVGTVPFYVYPAGANTPPSFSGAFNFGTFSIGEVQVPISVTGGNGTYAFSVANGSIPPGLSIRTDVPSSFPSGTPAGLIGVATTAGNYAFTLAATSGGVTSYQYCTIRITPLTFKDSPIMPTVVNGGQTSYNYTLTALNPQSANVTWSLASNSSMPSGLSLSSAGVISGTPDYTASSPTATISVTDGVDTISRTFTFPYPQIYFVGSTVLPNAAPNTSVSYQFVNEGYNGTPTVTATNLPAGLTLGTNEFGEFVLSGTVTATPGPHPFTATAWNNGAGTSRVFTLDVAQTGVNPAIILNNLRFSPIASLGSFFSGIVSVTAGGVAPFTWTVTGLPPGLSSRTYDLSERTDMAPGDIEVWGTPTALGNSSITFVVTDANGLTSTVTTPFSVSPLAVDGADLLPNGTVGTAYSKTLRVLGGTPPYTVSALSTLDNPLPDGLTFNAGTALVSGTPLEDGAFAPVFQFTDSASNSFDLVSGFSTVVGPGPNPLLVNGSSDLGYAVNGSAYTTTFVACCDSTYTWQQPGGTLPPGLSINSHGVLSGTPTTNGVYTFLVEVIGSNNAHTGFKQFTLGVTSIAITGSTTLPNGAVNTPYSEQLTATGGVTFVLGAEGPLPAGLSLSSSGLLRGTPTVSGQFLFDVIISNGTGNSMMGYYSLTIPGSTTGGPPSSLTITTAANLGTVSLGEVQLPLAATGGFSSYAWTLTSGSLPPGISIRSDVPASFPSGAQAGLIGVATTAGSYSFTLTVSSGGITGTQAFTLKVTGLSAQENSGYQLPDAFVGNAYSYQLAASGNGNNGAIAWSAPTGLPAGLTLSASGLISGTPTASGSAVIGFTIADSVDSVTTWVALNVSQIQVGIQGTIAGVLPVATQGALYTTTVTASGGTGPYVFSSTSLPPGLSLDPNTGIISGTPSLGLGRYPFYLTATDSTSAAYSLDTSLVVATVPPSLIYLTPYANLPDCSLGVTCSRPIAAMGGGTPPFSYTVTGLPAGMGFRSGSGATAPAVAPGDLELWGAPTASGTYNVQVTVTDATGLPSKQTFALKVSSLYVDPADYLPNGTRNAAYSKVLRVLGGIPGTGAASPYSVRLNQGVLPDGLTLSGMAVSGTPVENGAFAPELIYSDGTTPPNTLRITDYLTIADANGGTIAPTGYQYDDGSSINDLIGYFPVNAAMSFALSATGVPAGASLTWTLSSGALPSGVTLSTAGVLSGTPVTSGTYTFVLQAANNSNVGLRQYSMVITPVNITTTSPLPYGQVGAAYTTTLSAGSGATFSVVSDYLLPPGLTLSSAGVLSGTPTARGQFVFSVTASVSAGATSNKSYQQFAITIYGSGENPPLTLSLAPTIGPLPLGPSNTPLIGGGGKPALHYSTTPAAPAAPYFRVQDGGQMPAPFQTSVTGGLLGVLAAPGSFPTSVRVTDSTGATLDMPVTLIATSLMVLNPANPPAATVGTSYAYSFVPYGGSGTYTWSATGLPSQLTIGASTGLVSGVPSTAGVSTATITLTDSSNTSVSFNYTFTVNAFAITTAGALPQGAANTSYSQTLAAANCTQCSWSIVGGSLPNGLSLSTAGVISGTPTAAANATMLVQATGIAGALQVNVQKEFSLTVTSATPQPLYIGQNPTLYSTTVGAGYSLALNAQGGTPPYSWSVGNGGALPNGVSVVGPGETLGLNFLPGYYYLEGKPMAIGNYSFTLQVNDSASHSATQTFTWNVTPMNFNMTTFPAGGAAGTYGIATPTPKLGTAYSQPLLVTGGSGNYIAWTTPLASNPLPPGLSLNATTGVVSGTPTSTGQYSTLVQVNDDGGNTISQFLTFNVASSTSTTVNIGLGPNLGAYPAGGTAIFNINPSGGTAPYTISVVDSLPPGCAIETGAALLANAAGTYDLACAPLAPGTYTFTLKATDSAATSNTGVKQMNITFTPQILLTNVSLPEGSVGTAYSQLLLSYDNSGSANWSVTPGSALPPGLSLTGSTIGGTPSTAGSYSFSLTTTDSVTGTPIQYTFTLTISTITIGNPTVIPVQATYLMPYSYQFNATGGTNAVTFSASNLPPGLSMSASGLISGTPTGVGSYNVTVTATDNLSPVAQLFTLFVNYPELLSYSPAAAMLPDARVNGTYSVALTPSGGVAPFTWTVAAGSSLPAGLNFLAGPALTANSLPGGTLFGGIPATAGQYNFSLTVTDATNSTLTVPFSLRVSPISTEPGALPTGLVNTSYSHQLTAAGGTGPYAYAIYYPMGATALTTPLLPPGITISGTGLISGTPTSTGSYKFGVTVGDSAGHDYSTSYTLTVTNSAGLAITSNPPVVLPAGVGMSLQLATNGTSNYSWAVATGSTLPPGITLSSSGTLSGAASTPGSYTFTLTATDTNSTGNVAFRQYNLTVSALQLSFANTVPAQGTTGSAYSYQLAMAGGTPPYTFTAVSSQPLPPGLSLSTSGLLSGTPTQSGEFSIWATVSDSAGNTGWAIQNGLAFGKPGTPQPIVGQAVTTHDASAGVPYVLSSASLGTAIDGSFSFYGAAPVSFAAAAGSNLPPGMNIVPSSNGVPAYLAGTPTAAGSYTYSLVATDANNATATVQLTTHVSAISVSPALATNGSVGTPYSMTIAPVGGRGPYSFALAAASDMPPGLTFGSTGGLAGTPTVAGTFHPYFTLTDSSVPANTLTYAYTIVIDSAAGTAPGISISEQNPIQMTYIRTTATPAPYGLGVTETSGSFAFNAAVSGIPALSLSANTGTGSTTLGIMLDPSSLTSGVYNGVVGVQASSAVNRVTGIPITLTVLDPPLCSYTVSPASIAIAAAGASGSFQVSAGATCSWTAAASDTSFITVAPASSAGTGTANVQYTIAANTGASTRTGNITVGGQTFGITQFGSSCDLSLSPSIEYGSYTGGLATVNVITTNPTCAWTATGLGVTPSSGTGSGTVTFTIPANSTTSSQALTATVQLNGGGTTATFTANENGTNCTVSLSAQNATLGYTGGDGQVNVSTPAGCAYGTVAGPSWLTITSGASGAGPGPVALTFNATPNNGINPRSGTLTIGDQFFVVSQGATPCSFTLDTSAVSGILPVIDVPDDVIKITASSPSCSWSASSPVSWINPFPPYGTGNGQIIIEVLTNNASSTPRSTVLNVAGTSVAITQAGVNCTYALSSATGSVPYNGGTGKVNVIAPGACTWTAAPDPNASWLTISSTTGGNTQGTGLGFTAAVNPNPVARSGTIMIQGLPFTVTQGPGLCTYSLSSSGASNLSSSGVAGQFTFSTTQTGCSATATSYSGWLTTTTSSSQGGQAGTVNFTVAANPSGSTRTGTIVVGASTFTVSQQGATCSYTLTSYGQSFGPAGGTGIATATSIAGCTPQAGSTATYQWLQVSPVQTQGGTTYLIPFTVLPFNSTVNTSRDAQIGIGFGALTTYFTVKQTSY